MAIRAIPFWLALSLLVAGQTPKAADYAAHARVPGIEIGAKYLPHGLPSDAGFHGGQDLLVIDVAIFPETKNGLTISKNQFTLSVDGKLIAAQTPGVTTASGSLTAARSSQSADSAIELGGPPIRTPSSSKARELESMPRRPIALDSEQPPTAAPARKAALPEGLTNKPVSGYLFFRFDGNPKSIHSLELTYTGPGGVKTKLRIL